MALVYILTWCLLLLAKHTDLQSDRMSCCLPHLSALTGATQKRSASATILRSGFVNHELNPWRGCESLSTTLTQSLDMPRWSLYRPLGGVQLPKLIVSSIIAFIGGLGFDRFVFLDLPRTWRAVYISSLGSCFLLDDHPWTVVAIGLPTTLWLRTRLLATGGANLLVSVGVASIAISNAYDHIKRQRSGDSASSYDSWPMDVAITLHQLCCWFLAPRVNGLWKIIIKGLESRRKRWLLLLTLFLAGLWSFSGVFMPWVKVYYPHIYAFLVYTLRERPLYEASILTRSVRRRFDRFAFYSVIGRPPPFEYRPLEHFKSDIRLLELHAAERYGIVTASLINVPVSMAPPFEAISYRWSSGNEVPILVDGQEFHVSASVHEMLRSLRSRTSSRRLWIDSICINQQDSNERDCQVGLMRGIYRSADRVIGCLKVDSQIPQLLGSLSSLKELAATCESSDELLQSFLHGDFTIKFRSAIFLLCNEFFFRTWIVQEVALAQTMVVKLGEEEVLWDDFVKAAELFQIAYTIHASYANLPPLIGIRMSEAGMNIHVLEQLRSSSIAQNSNGLALSELLLVSINFESTDRRDRVFGILGLSTSSARNSNVMKISYQPHITEAIVSRNATKFTLLEESSFQLLSLAGIGYYVSPDETANVLDHPSWIPQWRAIHIKYTMSLVYGFNKLYKTATYAPVVISIGEAEGLLQIEGVCVDEVTRLSPIWAHLLRLEARPNTNTQEVLELCSGYLDLINDACIMAQEASPKIYSGGLQEDLVWRTICQESRKGLVENGTTFAEDGKSVQETMYGMRQLIKGRGFGANQVDIIRLHAAMLALLNKLLPMHGRRLCMTSQGYFGIVPPFTKEGDQIWAFSGAPSPFVLRPWKENSTASPPREIHKLVGICYLDGIMQGELEMSGLNAVVVNLT